MINPAKFEEGNKENKCVRNRPEMPSKSMYLTEGRSQEKKNN